MADPMKIRANVVGDSTEVKVLMNHEMETGQRKDAQGKMIPAWFIQNVTVDAQRQDRAGCAMGSGGREESVPVVQVQGRRQGRQGADHVDRQPRRQAHRRSDDRVIARLRDRRSDCAWRSLAVAIGGAFAQSSTVDEIAKYREALQDGNPAELWEARGEEMWKQPRGPKHGVVRDVRPGPRRPAWSRAPTRSCRAISPMPSRVMDLETRLVWCMVNQQGISEADATKIKFGDGSAAQVRPRGARRVRHVAVARRQDEGAGSTNRTCATCIVSARRCSSIVAARTISRARPATARTASASACRTCRT